MDLRIKKLYWQITALLLAAHFAGWSAGLPLAMALTLLQVGHFGWYRRDLLAFEVQVRAGYLGFLLAGTLPGCWPLHVIQSPVRGSIVDAVNKGRGQEQPPGRASTP